MLRSNALLGSLMALAILAATPLTAPAGDVNIERASRMLSEYIQVDTSVPPILPREPAPGYIDLLTENYVYPTGLTAEVIDGRIFLIRWIPDEPDGRAPVMFLGHGDVVPVADDELDQWVHPPFDGVIADGYVWGRGAIDNKGSSIALLEAITMLHKKGIRPQREIQLLIGPDEEIGGTHGTLQYIQQDMERFGVPAFVIDEGAFIVPDMVEGRNMTAIAVGEKGYLSIRVTTEAEAGHASMPYGESAPDILTRAMLKLNEFQFPVTMLPPMEGLLDAMGDELGGFSGFMLRNRWLSGPLVRRELESKAASNAMIRNTLVLTMINTGIKDNVIPAHAEAIYNVRLLPGQDKEEALATLRKVVDDNRVRIETHEYWGDTPMSPMEGEAWEAFRTAMERTVPDSFLSPAISPATTDSRHFAQAGIPAYKMVPFIMDAEDRQRIHGRNERLSLANLEQAIRFYEVMLEELIR